MTKDEDKGLYRSLLAAAVFAACIKTINAVRRILGKPEI
jgi:hypothetical protein